MAIEWRKTKVEPDVEVHHWQQHDPQELWRLVRSKPHSTAGKREGVWIHKLGKQKLAVRVFRGILPRKPEAPEELFKNLQQMAEQRIASLELPVAMIESPGSTFIATLWKGGKPAEEFLSRKSVSLRRKVRAAMSAMAELAKINAAGFTHGHPHAYNFRVMPNGGARLVDYKLLRPFDKLESADREFAATHLSSIIHGESTEKREQRLQLRAALLNEYDKRFREAKERMEK